MLAHTDIHSLLTKPLNTAYHNLAVSTLEIPPAASQLLGLGSKFCIENQLPKQNMRKTFSRLTRSVQLKAWIDDMKQKGKDIDSEYIPKLYMPSQFVPPIADWYVKNELDNFKRRILTAHNKLQTNQCYNLTKLQRALINRLRANGVIIITNTDKNLGISVMDRDQYMKSVLGKHLTKLDTYQYLTPTEANEKLQKAKNDIIKSVGEEYNQLSEALQIFWKRALKQKYRVSVFYGAPKIHKAKRGKYWKLRPVVAKYGLFGEMASKFVDYYLQQIRHTILTYLYDSYKLLDNLSSIKLEKNTEVRLLTVDADSFYTTIKLTHTMESLRLWFDTYGDELLPGFPVKLVLHLNGIIMKSNVFRFGDTYFIQLIGIAMGTSMACMYAMLYYTVHERIFLLPKYRDNVLYLRRFIDNIFALWKDTIQLRWRDFQNDLPFGRVTGSMKALLLACNFLDVTVTINQKTGEIRTESFEKNDELTLVPTCCQCPPTGSFTRPHYWPTKNKMPTNDTIRKWFGNSFVGCFGRDTT